MSEPRLHIGVLATHPIQYYAPWYRALAKDADLEVFFSHRQTAEGQAAAGFGVAFDWDVPLLDGYSSRFLTNAAARPDVERFWGCRTPEIAGIIRRGRFDAFIVHGWSTWSYWQAIQACKRTGTPVLVRGDSILSTPRSVWTRALKSPLYRAFIPGFDGYLVVGRRAREYVVHYGGRPDRCFPAPHAVDNDRFAAAARALRTDRAALRRTFDLPEDAVVFLFAGRFIGRKEPERFVTAVAAAAAADRRVFGLMVGDGERRAEVERLAASSAAPVRVAGFLNQSAIVRAYAASDVLVVPSIWETWGLVVNEAMACGLPAIVTDGVGCAGDLVLDGETGCVIRVGDTGALTAAVLRLTRDAGERDRLSDHARRHVEAFNVSAAVSGTIRAVRALAGVRAGDTRANQPSLPARRSVQ